MEYDTERLRDGAHDGVGDLIAQCENLAWFEPVLEGLPPQHPARSCVHEKSFCAEHPFKQSGASRQRIVETCPIGFGTQLGTPDISRENSRTKDGKLGVPGQTHNDLVGEPVVEMDEDGLIALCIKARDSNRRAMTVNIGVCDVRVLRCSCRHVAEHDGIAELRGITALGHGNPYPVTLAVSQIETFK